MTVNIYTKAEGNRIFIETKEFNLSQKQILTSTPEGPLRGENFQLILANVLLNGTNELEHKYIKVILQAWAILVAVCASERKFEQDVLPKAPLRHTKLK